MKRRLILMLMLLSLAALLLGTACQKVEKPAVKGKGPLSLQVMEGLPAPDYHKPADRWMATHMDQLNSGRMKQDECMACHMEPEQFCNKCHTYIGAKKVVVPKAG